MLCMITLIKWCSNEKHVLHQFGRGENGLGSNISCMGYPVYETQDGAKGARVYGARVARNATNIFIPHQCSQCVVEMELLHQLCVINKGRNP